MGQIDEVADLLTGAWLRRKRFEARLIAAAVGELLAGGKGSGQRRVAADEFVRMVQG